MKTVKIVSRNIGLLLVLIGAASCEYLDTISTGRTYVPDDQFERQLIAQGLDDVLDDYVLTANIKYVKELTLSGCTEGFSCEYGNPGYEVQIINYTGLQDFVSLKFLNLNYLGALTKEDCTPIHNFPFGTPVAIDLSGNKNLRSIYFKGTGMYGIDFSGNPLLESMRFRGAYVEGTFGYAYIENLDLSSNVNFKSLQLNLIDYIDNLDLTLSTIPSLEDLFIGAGDYDNVNLVKNENLRTLRIGGDPKTINYVNLKNGANENLESINLYSSGLTTICIEADNPTYVESVTTVSEGISGGIVTATITEDCGL